jgi:DNA ligase (NAD+)
MNTDLETLTKLPDFGNTMAESVIDFFSKDKTKLIIDKLDKANVNLVSNKKELKSDKFSNLTFCITGSFENITRNEIVSLIEENNGKCVGSVSKNLNYLISGEDSGSKLEKAKDLNIPIITIDELYDLINN